MRHLFTRLPGAVELAKVVQEQAETHSEVYTPLYTLDSPVPDKIRAVARGVYGARDVVFTVDARKNIREIERTGYHNLPICVAKTQYSFSTDPSLRGRPRGVACRVPANRSRRAR